ncbi:MAG: hypothetical protein AAGA11_00055 [Pseudomonadota bacterium]
MAIFTARSRAFNGSLAAAAVCLVSGLIAPTASAEVWRMEATYGAELSFDDNFRLNNEEQDQLEVTTVRALLGLSAINRSPAARSAASIRLNAYAFDDNLDELENRVDATLRYDTQRIQPRSEFRFGVSFLTDSLLQEPSLDAGSLVLPEDVENGLSRQDVRRQRVAVSPQFLYRLSPVSRMRLAGDISAVEHDNVTFQQGSFTVSTSLVDFVSTRLRGEYERDLDPINSWSTDIEVQDYDSDDAEFGFQSQILGAGFKHRFSETADISFRGAYQNTDFKSTAEDGSEDGFLAQVSTSRTTGRTRYTGRLGRNLFPSGSGDVVLADELIFNVVHQYSELVTLTWRNKLFQNRALRDNDNADRRFLKLEPSVNWRFKRWWVLDAGLQYRREKRDNIANPGISQAIFLGVTYRQPLQGGE